jgi:YD repeat-containing protein
MVAIVTGSGLGLNRGSGFVLGSRGSLGDASFGRYGENVTVNAATGNLLINRTDEILIGLGPDSSVGRSYNSLGAMNDDNGDNWRLNIQRKVAGLTGTVNTAGSTITRTDWDGSETVFTWDAGRSAYVSQEGAGAYDTLTYASGTNSWTWTDGDTRLTETYDNANGGRITASTDTDGNALAYAYDGSGRLSTVTTADGEVTALSWTGSNLTQLTTTKSGGATLTRTRYTYDASNRLSTVTTDLTPDDNSVSDGKTVVTTYTYDGTSDRVASISQTGGALLTIGYDGSNRVHTLTETASTGVTRVTTIDYSAGSTTVTDALGQVTTLTYDASKQLTQITLPPAQSGATAQTISYTYNGNGDVLTATDASGNVVTYQYDGNGNLTLQRDQAGNTITRTYGSKNELLTETSYVVPDPDGAGAGQPSAPQTTTYVYDAEDHLRFTITPEDQVTEYVYDTQGRQTSVVTYNDIYGVGIQSPPEALSTSQSVESGSSNNLISYNITGGVASGVNVVASALHGTVNVVGANIFYTPSSGYTGFDSISYYLTNSSGSSSTVTASITVTVPSTQIPAVVSSSATIKSNTTANLITPNISGLADSLGVVTGPAHGSLSVSGRSFLYTPTSGYAGSDSFQYTAINANGTSSTATISISITSPPPAPTAANSAQTVLQDSTSNVIYFNLSGGTTTSIQVIPPPSHGTVSGNGTSTITYTPNAGFSGTDTIQYQATNATGSSSMRTVTVTVAPSTASGAELIPSAFSTSSTYTGYTGLTTTNGMRDGVYNTLSSAHATSTGTNQYIKADLGISQVIDHIEIAPAGTAGFGAPYLNGAYVEYSTNNSTWTSVGQVSGAVLGQSLSVSLGGVTARYVRLRMASGYLAAGDFKVFSTLGGGPPIANATNVVVDQDSSVNPVKLNVAGNVTSVAVTSSPTHGTVTISGANAYYTPSSGYVGSDTFQYTVSNSSGASFAATANVTINATVPPPILVNSSQTIIMGSVYIPLSINAAGGYIGSGINIIQYPAHGSLIISGSAIYYTPDSGYIGADSMQYTASNRGGVSSPATININIVPTTNSELEYIPVSFSATSQYLDYSGLATAGGMNDGDFSSKNSVYVTDYVHSTDQYVTADLGSAKVVDYVAVASVASSVETPDGHGAQHGYELKYSSDGVNWFSASNHPITSDGDYDIYILSGLSARYLALASHTSFIAVGDMRIFGLHASPPVVESHGLSVNFNTSNNAVPLNISGPVSSISILSYPAHGTLSVSGLSVLYTPLAGFHGVDSFQYTATNANGTSAPATVGIVVNKPYGASATESSLNAWVAALPSKALVERVDTTYDFRGNISTQKSFTSVLSSGAGDTSKTYTTINYTYDQAGNVLSKQTSGVSNSEVFVYDGLGRLTAATDLNGGATTTVFSDSANQTIVTLANGLVRTSVFNYAGELVSYSESGTGFNTATTTYKYDSLGRLRMATDATGRTSYHVYDAIGRKIADIAADGAMVEYTYDVSNRNTATTTYGGLLSGGQLASLVDGSGNPANVTLASLRPVGGSAGDQRVWRVYDSANRLIEVIGGDGSATVYAYDGRSNLASTTSYANLIAPGTLAGFSATPPTTLQLPTADATHDNVSRNFYDEDGRLIGALDGSGYLSQILYNTQGEKVESVAFANLTTAGLRASGTFAQLLISVGTNARDIHNRYFYDNNGQLKYTLDANLRPTEYVYDAAGHMLHQIEYAGSIGGTLGYSLSYVAGQITSLGLGSNAANRTAWSVYDAGGRLAYVINAEGAVVAYAYDNLGQVVKKTAFVTTRATTSDPALATMNTWAAGQATNTLNRVTRFIYDLAGRVAYRVDAEGYFDATHDKGYVTEYRYDDAGRVTLQIRYADLYSFSPTIDKAGMASLIGTIPSTAVQTSFSYDADGRVCDSYDGMGGRTHFVYDALGRVTDKTVAYGTADAATTHTVYDAAGHVASVTLAYGAPEASTTSYTYDGMGNVLGMTDGRGFTTTYTYDTMGNVLTVSRPIDATYTAVTTNTYDGFGNLISSTDPEGGVTYYAYDLLNRLTWQVDAERYVTQTTYTIGDEVASVTRYFNQANTYAPALPPIVTANSGEDATTSFTRDNLGRVTKVTDAMGAHEDYVLNAFGDRTQVTNKLGGVTAKVFDRRGLLVSETMAMTSVLSNGSNEATSVTNTYQYDVRGNRTQMVEASGLAEARTTNYTYDKLDRLTKTTRDAVAVAGTKTRDASWALPPTETFLYDSRGNLVAKSNADGGVTLSYYDDLNRKIAEVSPAGTLSTWTYDADGNVTSQRVYGDQLANIPTDPNSQAAQVFRMYDLLLGRAPTDAEFTSWIWRMNNLYSTYTPPENWSSVEMFGEAVNSLEAIIGEAYSDSGVQARLGQADNTAFINQVYQLAFHRAPTSGEITDWLNAISAGWTRAGILTLFCEHPDHRAITTPLVGADYTTTPPSPINPSNYRETVYTYDRSNQLVTTTSGAALRTGAWNGTSYVTTTGTISTTNYYDRNGNVVQQTDGLGNSIYTFYDKLGRKVAQVDQEQYLTVWTLDADGNVTTETRYANKVAITVTADRPGQIANSVAALQSSAGTSGDNRTTTFTYDRNGRRLTETRTGVTAWTVNATTGALAAASTNSIVTYTYNALGEVMSKTEASGDSTTYAYDTFGRQTSLASSTFTDYAGVTVQHLTYNYYNGLNNLTRTVENAVRITTYAYNAAGNMTRMVDPNGYTHYTAYDVAGRVVRQYVNRTKSDDSTTFWEGQSNRYDAAGRVIGQGMSTWNGTAWSTPTAETQLAYDAYGEVTGKGMNARSQETNSYDAGGRVWKSTVGDGTTRLFLYDAAGNQTLMISSSGAALPVGYSWSTITIDQAVNLLTSNGASTIGNVVVAGMVVTMSAYDGRGLQTKIREPKRETTAIGTYSSSSLVTSKTYNAFGEVTSETDARGTGYTTSYAYNTMGRVIQQTDPQVSWTAENGGITTGAAPVHTNYYDLAGRLVGVKDANNNVNTRTLLVGTGYGDSDALAVKEFHADGGIFTSGYDVFNDLRKTVDETGKTETYTYDAMDNLVEQDHQTRTDGTQLKDYYSYDINGRRLKHWNSQLGTGIIDTTDYDSLGRVTSMMLGLDTSTGLGHATTYSYAWSGTQVTSGLGTFGGWTKTTTNTAGLTATETTDYFGRTVDKVDFGGHDFDYTYDRAGRLVSETNTASSQSTTYSWYNTGLMASMASTFTNSNYGYSITSTYQYDVVGNRTFEGETSTNTVKNWIAGTTSSYSTTHQASAIVWDALNRMVSVTDTGTTPFSISWEYDLNGNVRHMNASYTVLNDQGSSSGTTSQDYWYKYDTMNRFVLTRGVFTGTRGSGTISAGSTGTAISYDLAGRRATAASADGTDTYSYSADGYLMGMTESTGTSATYARDAMGRVTSYTEYQTGGSLGYSRTATYNRWNELTNDVVTAVRSDGTWVNTSNYYYDSNGNGTGTYKGGVVTHQTTTNTKNGSSQPANDTVNTYTWWDSAVSATTDYKPDTGSSTTYHSTYYYDGSGNLQSVYIQDGRPRSVSFVTDGAGQILERDEVDGNTSIGDPREMHFYLNGEQVGDVSNNGTSDIDYVQSMAEHRTKPGTGAFRMGATTGTSYANFDQSYDPINGLNYGSTAFNYTTHQGDTLQSIALAVWGDASYWYIIADANGLDGTETLVSGQTLRIPDRVHDVHNTSDTFKVYDPNDIIGNTSPTAPKPKHNHCGIFGQILLAIIAIAVSILTYQAINPATSMGVFEAGAAAGAAGSIVSQAVGVATGIQEKFSFKAVALSAVGGGVGAGIGPGGFFGDAGLFGTSIQSPFLQGALRGVVGNLATQGIGVATGLQRSFDWTGVAAAGVVGGVTQWAEQSSWVQNTIGKISNNAAVNHAAVRFVSGMAGGLAGAAARSVINGSDFGDNIIAVLPDVIGATVGGVIGQQLARASSPPSELDGLRQEMLNRPLPEFVVEGGSLDTPGSQNTPRAGTDGGQVGRSGSNGDSGAPWGRAVPRGVVTQEMLPPLEGSDQDEWDTYHFNMQKFASLYVNQLLNEGIGLLKGGQYVIEKPIDAVRNFYGLIGKGVEEARFLVNKALSESGRREIRAVSGIVVDQISDRYRVAQKANNLEGVLAHDLAFGTVVIAGALLPEMEPSLLGRGGIGTAEGAVVGETRAGTALQTYWPPNRGFQGTPIAEELGAGTRIDRYGYEGGTFLSPEGTPDWMRSLAPGTTTKPYNVYEVVKPIEVQSGKAAPWFGQVGQGTQYELPMSVSDAIAKGHLKRVGP